MADLRDLIVLSPEVAQARLVGRPLVALESTVISHGMPWPDNLATAHMLEAAVRLEGAVPATIAVIDGKVRIGLQPGELERLARGDEPVQKLSRRDLAIRLCQGGLGATTVAATMVAAHAAGIQVFATGGIGGVHRGAQQSFDISADLSELSRTPVAVVCAGAKSILDLPLTLEVLETLGVPVLGYGTAAFPAFYSRDSGLKVDAQVDDPAGLAAICRTHWQLGLQSGVLVANPVPEELALDPAVAEAAIAQALQEAADRGIRGKDTTPFLLARVKALTGGESLKTNVALIENNARLAAQLALALAQG
jgi:pseudouridine-5'-phosphate glycosidase